MAKFWLLLSTAAVCAVAAVGCEDNPDQFYKKAPAGAGNIWNNGDTPPVYDSNARNPFTDNFNASSKDQSCAGPVQHARWKEMVTKDIIPPKSFGGLDLRGGDSWTGLSFTSAQAQLCQAVPGGPVDAQTLDAHWGDASEVEVNYLIANNTINFVQLNPGYEGTMKFASRPDENSKAMFGNDKNPFGQHKYEWAVGQPIKKDGTPMILDWTNIDPWATELFDAMMYTFAPELPGEQDNCRAKTKCLARVGDANSGLFGARPLGMYMYVQNIMAPQPAASTPYYLYAFYVKLMPFSTASMFLKLDREGPVAISANLGDRTPKVTCTQKLGMKYSDFLDNCVNILQDNTANTFTKGKLLGGLAHTKEVFNFTVQGVDTDFASSIIGEDKIVGDDWLPSPTDTVYHFNMDIRSSGTLVNELDKINPDGTPAPGSKSILAGTGLVYREFQRRTQADIVRMMKDFDPNFVEHKIGAPECMMVTGNDDDAKNDDPNKWGPGKRDPKTGLGGPAAGCTGLEQMVTPAAHKTPDGAGVDDGVRRMSIGGRAVGKPFAYLSAMKPGDPNIAFCVDPPPGNGQLEQDEVCSSNDACFSESCSERKRTGKGDAGATCTTDADCNSDNCQGADGAKTCSATNNHKCDDVTKKYFHHCGVNDAAGAADVILQGTYNRVLNYLGHGDILKLPPALRDRKYYFQQLGYAIVKYLHAAGNLNPRPLNLNALGPTDCSGMSCEPDAYHLQFDQIGPSADRAKLEYIDRRFSGDPANPVEPLSYEYETLIVSGNQQESRFQRMLERDEKSVFTAMSEDRTKPLASPGDNVSLTNIIGSPVIAGMGYAPVKGDETKRDAYYCATHVPADPDCSQGPPTVSTQKGKNERCPTAVDPTLDLDDNCNPILTNYKGAFGETAFTLGTSHLKLVDTLPDYKSAKVAVPIYDTPYDASGTNTSAAGPKLIVTLPDWRPLAPGAGFRIPVNAQRDKFIPAAQVDFSGQNVSLAINYSLDDKDKSMKILGVESQTFEGELFMCQDPVTSDLLHVRQYDSVAEILDWFEDHAGSRDACQVLIRYSPFNDSPVTITSKSAGVLVTVGQGVGIGRIIDALFFDPTL